MQEQKIILQGLNCADCSQEIEKSIKQLESIEKASVNYATQELNLQFASHIKSGEVLNKIKQTVQQIDPDITVRRADKYYSKTTSAGRVSGIKAKLIKLLLGSGIFLAAVVTDLEPVINVLLYTAAYLTIGHKVLYKTGLHLVQGKIFDENFLMTLATLGAFSIGEYPEGVAVMLFYEIGETVKDAAVNKSRRSIKALLDIKPEYANLQQEENVITVNPEEVDIGDIIIVKPGEKIPLDGKVIKGDSLVDTSALTGESVPERKKSGDKVLSGSINKNGLLTVKVTESFDNSAANRIIELIENAASKKAKTERFISKFASYYTPAVVMAAASLAIIPPILLEGANFNTWLYRALVFLVISCPCALVISIPLGFFGGIGAASRQGILIKGANHLEALYNTSTLLTDKTGTITEGVFAVTDIQPAASWNKEELLKLAVRAEKNSNHPLAEAIKEAAYSSNFAISSGDGDTNPEKIDDFTEIPGQGVKARVDGNIILAGNSKLMKRENINYKDYNGNNTIVHVAWNSSYVGQIQISDKIKKDSSRAIKKLTELGKKVIMLTGDRKEVAAGTAAETGISNYFAELLPEDKVDYVEKFMARKNNPREKLAFIGDGINDAPVLARSDIGIAMGGLGSDAAIEAADIVLMNDSLADVVKSLDIAEKTRNIVLQNIVLALGVKGLFLLLGALGMTTMWGAVFADVGVALLAVLNSVRIIR